MAQFVREDVDLHSSGKSDKPTLALMPIPLRIIQTSTSALISMRCRRSFVPDQEVIGPLDASLQAQQEKTALDTATQIAMLIW